MPGGSSGYLVLDSSGYLLSWTFLDTFYPGQFWIPCPGQFWITFVLDSSGYLLSWTVLDTFCPGQFWITFVLDSSGYLVLNSSEPA